MMAGSAETTNVLSQLSGMLALEGKVRFFDPETGRKIKVKIEKPKPTSRFWPFGSKKKQERAVVADSVLYADLTVSNLTGQYEPVTRTYSESGPPLPCDRDPAYNPRPRAHRDLRHTSRRTSGDYEDIYDDTSYGKACTAEENEPDHTPDHTPRPSPESHSGGSSDEDSFDKEFKDNYQAMKRRASDMYVNVPDKREPLYSSISNRKRAALSTPDAAAGQDPECSGHFGTLV